jgi:LPS sulfotransferase NodH
VRRKAVQTLREILEGPDWLLVGFSEDWRKLVFVETTREILSTSPFIDGRTPLSRTDQTAEVDVADALKAMARTPAPRRLILHTGFCGSTLLARLVQSTGDCISYKEPDALVALSTSRGPDRTGDREWRRLVDLTARQFSKGWGGEVGVIKPSNWALNLAGDLCEGDARAVFISMDARSFLIAVLRGGRERLDFMLKLVSFLRKDFRLAQVLVAGLERDKRLSVIQRTLRLALVGLAAQQSEHDAVAAKLGADAHMRLTYAELMASPAEMVARVREVLGVAMRDCDRKAALADTLSHYSKSADAMFDKDGYARADQWIKDHLGEEIDRALDWGEKELELA